MDDLEGRRRGWDDARRRSDASLLWPFEPYRDDRSILVAGCGTRQAAHYAVRWPRAKVVGIDFSTESLHFARRLKEIHGLRNLELRELAVEDAASLGRTFDHVVCTGVLHHLADPGAGLRALRAVMAPGAVLHLMVYAPYGRAGIYLLQEYCRRLGLGSTSDDIVALAASLKALPPDHPIVPLLRSSPDFAEVAGLADALLHPCDRSYSVPQLIQFLDDGGLRFGRWIRQAPYLASCGAIASTPHAPRLLALPLLDQYAALELFRGSMVRHSVAAYARGDERAPRAIDVAGEAWHTYVPLRAPETIVVRERLPPGAASVLVNRGHTFTDLYLPLDAEETEWFTRIDGRRTMTEVAPGAGERARRLFWRLWDGDHITVAGRPSER